MKKIILLFFLSVLSSSVFAQTDSLGIYAVLPDTTIQMKHTMSRNFEVGSPSEDYATTVFYRGITSKYKFKNTARFRIYLREQSKFSAEDLGIIKFKVVENTRTFVSSKITRKGVEQIKPYAEDKFILREISPYIYEAEFSEAPGEYGLTPFLLNAAGLVYVWDFTIESDNSSANSLQKKK